MQNSGRTKVFISSCPRDIKYLDRLKIHLAFLERDELGEIWDDEKILPGSLRNEKINEELLCAKVAVLLISADFLASKFIAKIELPSLLAAAQLRGVVILPVILSPCRFSDSELSQFQAVNNPSKPLTSMNFNDKEKVWDKLAETIKDVIDSITC